MVRWIWCVFLVGLTGCYDEGPGALTPDAGQDMAPQEAPSPAAPGVTVSSAPDDRPGESAPPPPGDDPTFRPNTSANDTINTQATLASPTPTSLERFGHAVDIDGDTAVIGAPESGGRVGAVYVYVRTGGTWSLQATLTGSNTEVGDKFGWSVAVSGDTIAVGAPLEGSDAENGPGDNSAPSSGAVYVFTRSGSTWSEQAYVKATPPADPPLAPDPVPADWPCELPRVDALMRPQQDDSIGWIFEQFGDVVALDGDTLVVGAPGFGPDPDPEVPFEPNPMDPDPTNPEPYCGPVHYGHGAGRVVVFTRSGTAWNQQAVIDAPVAGGFGQALAIDGSRLAIGAPLANGRDGAVYVFEGSGSTWAQLTVADNDPSTCNPANPPVPPSIPVADGLAGTSVALSGDTVYAGAPQTNGRQGRVYTWVYDGTPCAEAWGQPVTIVPDRPATDLRFGATMALDSGRLVVGAPGDSRNEDLAGAVIIINTSTFALEASAFGLSRGDEFGHSLAMDGGTFVAGVPGVDNSGESDGGAGVRVVVP